MTKLIATVLAGFCAVSLYGQPPAPKNLQVFPKDIAGPELIQNMRLFNQALGVQCTYCHVEREFDKDDKPTKTVARSMIRMVHDMKESADKYLPDGRAAKVGCWTCHRGSGMIDTAPPLPPPASKKGAPKA